MTPPCSGKLADAKERSHYGRIALPAKPSWCTIDLDRKGSWGTLLDRPRSICGLCRYMWNLTRLNWFKRSPGLYYVVATLGVTTAVIAALLLETYLQTSPIVSLF